MRPFRSVAAALLVAGATVATMSAHAQGLPANTPGATPPTDRLAPTTMVVTGGVAVHAEASTSSPTIGSLKPGQRVQVLTGNAESGWYRLADGGFAIMDHLAPAESSGSSSTAPR
jgi:uncharacterized protein YgiM (DUF1202 family)